MNAELQAIRDAWDATPRQEETARSLSDAYVLAHPEEFTEFETMSLDDMMGSIDTFREAGPAYAENVQRIETWFLHRYQPQNIGGIYQPQIRIVGSEI